MLAKLQLSIWDFFKPPKPSFKKTVLKHYTSNPELKYLWKRVRKQWFPDRPEIDHYTVCWSTRPQKRTLASCNVKTKRVLVARELNYPQHRNWLEPLLYHEMCHAVLGYVQRKSKRVWHGKEFKSLEMQHPLIKDLDLWIKAGGWQIAVRSDRGKRAATKRPHA